MSADASLGELSIRFPCTRLSADQPTLVVRSPHALVRGLDSLECTSCFSPRESTGSGQRMHWWREDSVEGLGRVESLWKRTFNSLRHDSESTIGRLVYSTSACQVLHLPLGNPFRHVL